MSSIYKYLKENPEVSKYVDNLERARSVDGYEVNRDEERAFWNELADMYLKQNLLLAGVALSPLRDWAQQLLDQGYAVEEIVRLNNMSLSRGAVSLKKAASMVTILGFKVPIPRYKDLILKIYGIDLSLIKSGSEEEEYLEAAFVVTALRSVTKP